MADREVEWEVEPLFDDVDVGDLEGWKIEDYRTWKHSHARDEAFPGGESLNGAARRYAEAFQALLAGPHPHVLVVTHEIPIRYALNGLAGWLILSVFAAALLPLAALAFYSFDVSRDMPA